MIDRRGDQRLQVDAHLADLQSELEAGARMLERISSEASRVDKIIAAHIRQAGLTRQLLGEIVELRHCIEQQQTTLAELRGEMRTLRKRLSQVR